MAQRKRHSPEFKLKFGIDIGVHHNLSNLLLNLGWLLYPKSVSKKTGGSI